MNATKSQLLEDRTTRFGRDVIGICKSIKLTPISSPVVTQVVKSATAIGANYAEANNASSKRDFANKIYLCRKEAQETKHWLLILEEIVDNKNELGDLRQECYELILIFNKISSTMRNGKINEK